MLISVTGRKTERTYTTPVAYVEDAGQLLIAAGGRWRENLKSRPDVRVVLRGKSLSYRASIVSDEREYGRHLDRMATLNPTWARYSGLELSSDGRPTGTATERARARGLTLVKLQPVSSEPSNR
jgi:deazaflavin-dependent oxidoreductase (nitroreductase family)